MDELYGRRKTILSSKAVPMHLPQWDKGPQNQVMTWRPKQPCSAHTVHTSERPLQLDNVSRFLVFSDMRQNIATHLSRPLGISKIPSKADTCIYCIYKVHFQIKSRYLKVDRSTYRCMLEEGAEVTIRLSLRIWTHLNRPGGVVK